MYRLANTTIDRVTDRPQPTVTQIISLLETDALLFIAASPPALVKEQKQAWVPLIDQTVRRYGPLELSQCLQPCKHPDATVESIRREITSLNPWPLASIGELARSFGSILLALAVYRNEIGLRNAWLTSNLEERVQARIWGDDDCARKRRIDPLTEILEYGQVLTETAQPREC